MTISGIREDLCVPCQGDGSRCARPNLFGLTQALGGIALGLIALFSSYDHITLAGTSIGLQQQWGILFIAASVATVVVVAEGFCVGEAFSKRSSCSTGVGIPTTSSA
jgi:hypothetical protein